MEPNQSLRVKSDNCLNGIPFNLIKKMCGSLLIRGLGSNKSDNCFLFLVGGARLHWKLEQKVEM